MKIFAEGRLVDAFLEGITWNTEAHSDLVNFEMTLIFDSERDMRSAARAMPVWIVQPDKEREGGERMLAEKFLGEPKSAEEKVAAVLMGLGATGPLRITAMREERRSAYGLHVVHQVSLRATVKGFFWGAKE